MRPDMKEHSHSSKGTRLGKQIMGKQSMGKQKQRSDVYRTGKYCESCHCYVAQGNLQQHNEGIRHRRRTLQNKYGTPIISQFESVPPLSEDPAPAPSQDARSLVAAIVGTGRIYHKTLKALSRVSDVLQGRSRVDQAANGRGRTAHAHPRPNLHAIPLDVQIVADCIDDDLIDHGLEYPVETGELEGSQPGSSRHTVIGVERAAPDTPPSVTGKS